MSKAVRKKHALSDDSGLSLNNGKNVRYRLRKQEELEADQLLKEWENQDDNEDPPPEGVSRSLYS